MAELYRTWVHFSKKKNNFTKLRRSSGAQCNLPPEHVSLKLRRRIFRG